MVKIKLTAVVQFGFHSSKKSDIVELSLEDLYGESGEILEQAVSDAYRSGRKRKLSEKEQEQFEATVHESPVGVGFNAPAWTPALIQQHLDETYDVEYSIPSCRRLLKEAGLSYQKPRRTAVESDTDEQETFREEFKKAAGDGRHSSEVCSICRSPMPTDFATHLAEGCELPE